MKPIPASVPSMESYEWRLPLKWAAWITLAVLTGLALAVGIAAAPGIAFQQNHEPQIIVNGGGAVKQAAPALQPAPPNITITGSCDGAGNSIFTITNIGGDMTTNYTWNLFQNSVFLTSGPTGLLTSGLSITLSINGLYGAIMVTVRDADAVEVASATAFCATPTPTITSTSTDTPAPPSITITGSCDGAGNSIFTITNIGGDMTTNYTWNLFQNSVFLTSGPTGLLTSGRSITLSINGLYGAIMVTIRDADAVEVASATAFCATPTPSKTRTPTAGTLTISTTPSKTDTPSDTPTPTITETPSNTFTPTYTYTSTPTPTFTPTATGTSTLTPTATDTPTITLTPTPTATHTRTSAPPAQQPTKTFTPFPIFIGIPSYTRAPSSTASSTSTRTVLPSASVRVTSGPSATPTLTSVAIPVTGGRKGIPGAVLFGSAIGAGVLFLCLLGFLMYLRRRRK